MSNKPTSDDLRCDGLQYSKLSKGEGITSRVQARLTNIAQSCFEAARLLDDGKTARQVYEYRRRVDPEHDDLVIAIRKLGGLNVDLETDWQGRLLHLNEGFNWPSLEQSGGGEFFR